MLTEGRPSGYSRALLAELRNQAERTRIELGLLTVPWTSETKSYQTRMVDDTLELAKQYEAVVLIAGLFSNALHHLARFAQHWSPRPIMSIGYKLPGCPSVLLDNVAGCKQATTHLIEVHGRKKILFLRGKRDNQEGEQRYLGYRRALRDAGILYDERRILAGQFSRRGAVRALLGMDPDLSFDAIVAANDDMALGAMSELARRGIRVPQDVSLVGFDDIPEAAEANISLSTMAQPFSELATHAVHSILNQLQTMSVTSETVSVQLVARESCGC